MNNIQYISKLLDEKTSSDQTEKIAIISDDVEITYQELSDRVLLLARYLSDNGIGCKDKVLIASNDFLGTLTNLLACFYIGADAALTSSNDIDHEFKKTYVNQVKPKLIVFGGVSKSLVDREAIEDQMETSVLWYEGIVSTNVSTGEITRGEHDVAVTLFTSGSTGEPRAMPHKFDDLVFVASDYAEKTIGANSKDVFYSPSPIYFAYGLNTVLMSLYHGASCVLASVKQTKQSVMDNIRTHKVSIFFAVPTMYHLLLTKVSKVENTDLRFCISAGESLPGSVYERWKEAYAIEIVDGIGSTEVLSTFITNRPEDNVPGSIGKLVEGFQAQILDEDGTKVKEGEPGVLWVKGPTVSTAAFEMSPDISELQGWCNTKDIVSRDDQGVFRYCGRQNDVVKVSGKWTSPLAIEAGFINAPYVEQCAAICFKDQNHLLRSYAFIVLEKGVVKSPRIIETLKNHIIDSVGKSDAPHFIEFVSELPKTATGKIKRDELRRQYKAKHFNENEKCKQSTREGFNSYLEKGFNQVPYINVADNNNNIRPIDIIRMQPEKSRVAIESTKVSEEGRYSIIPNNIMLTFKSKVGTYWIDGEKYKGDPISCVKRLLKKWSGVRVSGMPLFCGGAIGWFGYESSHYFESLPKHRETDKDFPDILLYFVDEYYVIDHIENQILLVATGDEYEKCKDAVNAMSIKLASIPVSKPLDEIDLVNLELHDNQLKSNFEKEEYVHAVNRVREYIRSGDTYQVNLSQRFEVDYEHSHLALYDELANIDPVHFASYFETEDFTIVSASPERLVKVEDGMAVTRPIAGIRRRGTIEEDNKFKHELRTNRREQAEHAMLVDLERNDLGRVCEYGSVEVSKLMETIYYAHVMHIESEVTGKVQVGNDCIDVLEGVFPGGTITGVPKIRTMEIITELEPNDRGIYTGSIGYISFAGDMDLNIVIRTIYLKGKKAYIQVGGGVVYDSDPHREYRETINKARSQLTALESVKKRKEREIMEDESIPLSAHTAINVVAASSAESSYN